MVEKTRRVRKMLRVKLSVQEESSVLTDPITPLVLGVELSWLSYSGSLVTEGFL